MRLSAAQDVLLVIGGVDGALGGLAREIPALETIVAVILELRPVAVGVSYILLLPVGRVGVGGVIGLICGEKPFWTFVS